MESTEKLFYQDSYQKKFEAVVLECEKKDDLFRIVLNQTAFFPEGGGQYADTGRLNNVEIVDAQEEDGVIYHLAKEAINVGRTVTGEIDWEERFMKMQQHTGEHIVSGIVNRIFGYQNVGFHLGSTDCTLDFNGEISKEELDLIEKEANKAVSENVDVIVYYPSDTELKNLEYRSKIEIEGQVRIVSVTGYDVCACCAPHVNKTGEIGLIKIVNSQRYKGGMRLTMLCGERALTDYKKKQNSVKEISALLCAKEDEVAEAVVQLKDEVIRLKQKIAGQQEQLLGYIADQEEPKDGMSCVFVREIEGDGPRYLMNLLMKREEVHVVAVFAQTGENTYRYVIGSNSVDLRAISKEFNQAFHGRGGGKAEMIQGSLTGTEGMIKDWIREKVRINTDESKS